MAKTKRTSGRAPRAKPLAKRPTAKPTQHPIPLVKDVKQHTKELQHTFAQIEHHVHDVHLMSERVHKRTDALHAKVKPPKTSTKKKPDTPAPFPIVGIGASAGGLEAMTQFLEALPASPGLALVFVQHLDPTHESALTSLLSRSTGLPVDEAEDNMKLEPDHLYIIPPNKLMRLAGRQLKLSPRKQPELPLPIDAFFRSLAEQEGSRAIGVILSGNGSDGTQGLLAIKAAGGITFAQEEKTAKFPAMSGSAIAAGCVDFVMSAGKIAAELGHFTTQAATAGREGESEAEPPEEQKAFADILTFLRQRTAVDFSFYKRATLLRRIHRRMMLHKCATLEEYSDYLRQHVPEVHELFNDMLIHVTGFFRDPAVFDTLKKRVFPRLLKNKRPDEAVRIWIPGCSTGEEVYSIAIALVEFMNEKKQHHPVQIFGTDIHNLALDKARSGFYAQNIKSEVSAGRLRRYFIRADGGYRVNKSIRQLCIFARQNLVADPPFSNLDLISCRNVLIYLGLPLQRKVMPVFHYALRTDGLLLLGASESIGGFGDLFTLIDTKGKVYAKKAASVRPSLTFGHVVPTPEKAAKVGAATPPAPTISEVQKQADRIVLASYSPAGVIINAEMEVLQFRGRTGPYLEHVHGEASLNLLKMAREGLELHLRTAVHKAIKGNVRVRQHVAAIKQNGHSMECSLEVIPFTLTPKGERFYLVLFEPPGDLPPSQEGKKKSRAQKAVQARAVQTLEAANLRAELASTRESLQSLTEEYEATNEELRSANEEIMSSNQELQSTNEELETASEELQSTNEELTTLNDELESRNIDLQTLNNDLHNLLASVNIPVIILGSDLRIRRFTAGAEKLLKLIPSDVGRPITDINLPLEIPSMDKLVPDVLDSLSPKDVEIRDKTGHWWSVRIRAYKTTDYKIDGVVIALVDINALKTNMEHVKERRNFAEAIVNTVREPLIVLDQNLVVKSANQTFYRTFQVSPEETIDRRVYDLGNRQWDIPKLRTLLEEILPQNTSFNDFEVEHEFPHIGKKRMWLNARRLTLNSDGEQMILLAIEEVSGA